MGEGVIRRETGAVTAVSVCAPVVVRVVGVVHVFKTLGAENGRCN